MSKTGGHGRRLRAALATLAVLGAGLVSAGVADPVSAEPANLHGHVFGNGAPRQMLVGLFRSDADGGTATQLGSTVSAADGSFDIAYAAPTDPNAVLYVTAITPVPPGELLTLATVLGTAPFADDIVVNERSTVATGYAMSQFTDNFDISGPSPGLQNAAGMFRNLVDVATGNVGTVLGTSPNGGDTEALATFNSLANMLAACVTTPANCTTLFNLATVPGEFAPNNTLQAIVNINQYPSQNAPELFTLSELPPTPYSPARTVAPDAWTLALRFVGDGVSMDGPGNMAVDTYGNIWVTNNYEFAPGTSTAVCGSKLLLAFSPTGQYLPGSPFAGGGLDGAGWGIDIDPFGDIWVSNFGFAAPPPDGGPIPGCPTDQQPKHNSVSKFSPDGTALSPSAGFTQGNITWPQGTKSDQDGNIWIANCENSSVTVYRDGDPQHAQEITGVGLEKPFAVAHNNEGDAFVTGVQSNNVVMLQPDGTPAPGSPISGGGINRPMGIIADSEGNQWVANSGLVDLPCPALDGTGSGGGSVTLITKDGQLASPTAFTGGGLTVPWGIAVDGNDNVWVANFAGKRVSQFCGLKPATCPPGKATGDPISPGTGYGSDGLVRNTGVVIDPSGNVWLANNWKEVPIQTNPGGYEMVAYVGLAAPVHRAAPIPKPAAVVPAFTG